MRKFLFFTYFDSCQLSWRGLVLTKIALSWHIAWRVMLLSKFFLLQRIIFFPHAIVLLGGSSVKKSTELYDLCWSHTLVNLTATPLPIEHFSESPHSLSAFAEESPTGKNFSTGSKNFQFATQSPWSRTAVSVDSQCIRHQIGGDCAANPRKLQYDSGECTETALRIILGIKEMT